MSGPPANSNNQHNRRRSSRRRSGVGAIIGGTMLVLILFTSVFIYFLVIMQTSNEKTKNEVQAANFDEEKRSETFIVGPITQATDDQGNDLLQVRVNNAGPLPLEARYVVVTSEDPPSRKETALGEIMTGPDTSKRYLNPGETALFLANVEGDVVDPDTVYKVDVVSSRGNIISTTYPPDSSTGAFNTGENVGDGVAVYIGMGGEDGTVLQFRTIEAGTGIIITDPGEDGNGIGIAVDVDDIASDPRLILHPQIQGIFPNLFGAVGSSSSAKGLWGVVVANPTESTMHVRSVVVTAYSPSVGANIFTSSGGGCPLAPTYIIPSSTDGTWNCPGTNMLRWSANSSEHPNGYPIPARSAQEFLVGIGRPSISGNDPLPSYAVNFNVFTDYGQFAKAGYASSMTKSNSEIANAYLTTASSCTTPCTTSTAGMIGKLSATSGSLVGINAAIGNFGDVGQINAGSRLIVAIPKVFEDVNVTSSTGFSECSVIGAVSEPKQISCKLSSNLTAGDARTIQFTMTAPPVNSERLYSLFVLADGLDGNGWPIGPVSENVIRVTPES